MGRRTAIALTSAAMLGSAAAPDALAQTRTRGEPPVFPQELLDAEVMGVSLGTDPALVPAILLANGFEPDPDARGPSSVAPDAVELHYRRGNGANVRPGESFDYYDVVTTTDRGGSTFVRHRRELSYWRTYERPPVTAGTGPGRWDQNPDQDWFIPIFEIVCAYQAQSTPGGDPCIRSDEQLNSQATTGMALILNAYSTEVRLSGAPDMVR